VSQIYHLGLGRMVTICGLQEMPYWSIDPQKVELLRRDQVTLGTEWQTMNSSQNVGLNRIGNTHYTNSSCEVITG